MSETSVKSQKATSMSGKEWDEEYKKLKRMEAWCKEQRAMLEAEAEQLFDPNAKIQAFKTATWVPATEKVVDDLELAESMAIMHNITVPKKMIETTDTAELRVVILKAGLKVPQKIQARKGYLRELSKKGVKDNDDA